MGHQLRNENVLLEFDLPEEGYSKTRFDWSGKVTRVVYRGITVSGSERKDPPATQWGQAFYNEFGIQEAVGFNEIPVGGWFHKIGVGLLQKGEAEYFFHKDHLIKPCEFKIEMTTDQVRIHCHGSLTNGIAYELVKTIGLRESGFFLTYELMNTGHKPIPTDEYNHNFLAIDNRNLDEDYALFFAFTPDEDTFDEVVNPGGKVMFEDKEIRWKDTPSEQFFFSNLSGGKLVPAQWQLINRKVGIGIEEKCSFMTSKINLWGWRHVVSPELFFPILLEPGQSEQWTRDYRVFSI